jgi:succinate dehydrogenase/fumarate reductase flavoprotein subunit
MAKGGSTHEQGYDDREDESLAMRHGKIARKHFVGSHKRKEHSRRDDAHFETRHKKAYGGLTDSSIELLD